MQRAFISILTLSALLGSVTAEILETRKGKGTTASKPGHGDASDPSVAYRWKGFCTSGGILDGPSVDAAHGALRNWAATSPVIKTTDHNLYISEIQNNAVAYACTDNQYDSQTFTQADIDAAFAAMDLNCAPYQPSYALLEVTGTGIQPYGVYGGTSMIIGKAWTGQPVCQGAFGGMERYDATPGQTIAVTKRDLVPSRLFQLDA